MRNSSNVKVYADINCPFCFALHERLYRLDLLPQVEWRTIEHAPSKDEESNSPKKLILLEKEYALLTQRAPDIECNKPRLVPNTSIANTYINAVAENYPEKLISFRTLVYRAHWQQGLNIENIDILDQLLAETKIHAISFSNQSLSLLRWQNEWQHGDFDLRIPSMHRVDNEVLLGLQNPETIKKFIQGSDVEGKDSQSYCQFVSNSQVYILSENNQQGLTSSLTVNSHYDLMFFKTLAAVLYKLSQKTPELIIIDSAQNNAAQACLIIKEATSSISIPVIVVSLDGDRSQEALSFSKGAVDFICLPEQQQSFLSRVRLQIKLKQQIDMLSEFANKDGLTGLFNRREFDRHLEKSWRHACRYQQKIGIILLDIDYFKEFNDRYGHPEGDEALVKLALAISNSLFRAEDFSARYGGEEFVIVITNMEKEGLFEISQRIQQEVKQLNIPHEASTVSSRLTVSMGICITNAHADNHYNMLVKNADKALYQAKQSGRNKSEFKQLLTPHYN